MATNIKHTLFNLEVTPPPGAWPAIAARLNTEYDADDIPVAQKMFDISVTPPAGLWTDIASQLNTASTTDEVSVGKRMYELLVTPPVTVWKKIAAQLPQQTGKKETGKVITLHSRRAIAAAAAMVLLTLGAWYFLDKTNSADNPNTASQSAPTAAANKRSGTQARTSASDTEIGEGTIEQLSQKPLAALTAADASLINNRFGNRHGARRTAFYDYQPIATSYASIDEQALDFTEENSPAVEAPLIRDAKGQVILDKKLITSPDDCYINITSPNGEPTRISSKFLHIISTINDDVEPQDYFDFMMQENSLWRIRFQEWKEKFLNQSSLVPTPTSFTDILELKDFLIENQ